MQNYGKGHRIRQCPAKDKACNKCNEIGHFANKCRSFPSVFQGSQVQRLQTKSFTKPHQGSKPVLSRNEPIHLMTTDGCIGVSDFGTIDDNFETMSNGWNPQRLVIILQQTIQPINPDHTQQQSTTPNKDKSHKPSQ